MLPLAPTVTRPMATMAIAIMATDQIMATGLIMATDHMPPGMDTDPTDHMRRHLDLERIGHLHVQHGVPGGGDVISSRHSCFMSS